MDFLFFLINFNLDAERGGKEKFIETYWKYGEINFSETDKVMR